MGAQRRCLVVSVEPKSITLRPLAATCSGCVGCGGRCSLFPEQHERLVVGRDQQDDELRPNDEALVYLDEAMLLRQARMGYGLPLLGLLLGALLGRGLAQWLAIDADPMTALLALAGTLIGLPASKHFTESACRVRSSSLDRPRNDEASGL